jgi:hypothetical protein
MRGALLIVVAVLLGAGLLANGFRDDHVASGSGATPTTTRGTTVPAATGSTVIQAHDPAQVKVLVLNGSGKSGVAKAAKDQLAAANYTVLEPGNVTGGTVTVSIVYFVPGYDVDAGTIAAKLGLPAGAAQPLPNPPTTAAANERSVRPSNFGVQLHRERAFDRRARHADGRAENHVEVSRRRRGRMPH